MLMRSKKWKQKEKTGNQKNTINNIYFAIFLENNIIKTIKN